MIARLRAVMTPAVLGVLAVALMMMGIIIGDNETPLEKRVSKTLSQMKGAGEVRVVISTKEVGSGTGGITEKGKTIPCGVVAIVEGADDPIVCAEMTRALGALLGLPASAVSVLSGGE